MSFSTFLDSTYWWLRYRILRDRRAHWNYQYAVGRWEKLKSPAEYARFDACVKLLRDYMPDAHVLELGCGEALLQQRLKPDDYLTWFGVDISEVSIKTAQAFANERVQYRVDDIDTLNVAEKFDAIIFSESLSYLKNRDAVLDRYRSMLAEGGVFIISIFNSDDSMHIWEEIHRSARPIDAITTSNEVGTWICEILRPRELAKLRTTEA